MQIGPKFAEDFPDHYLQWSSSTTLIIKHKNSNCAMMKLAASHDIYFQ